MKCARQFDHISYVPGHMCLCAQEMKDRDLQCREDTNILNRSRNMTFHHHNRQSHENTLMSIFKLLNLSQHNSRMSRHSYLLVQQPVQCSVQCTVASSGPALFHFFVRNFLIEHVKMDLCPDGLLSPRGPHPSLVHGLVPFLKGVCARQIPQSRGGRLKNPLMQLTETCNEHT